MKGKGGRKIEKQNVYKQILSMDADHSGFAV